jgi:hypothetical protein
MKPFDPKTATKRQLVNEVYKLMNTENCKPYPTSLKTFLMTKTNAALVEQYQRWHAILSLTEAEMRRHCQLDGLIK